MRYLTCCVTRIELGVECKVYFSVTRYVLPNTAPINADMLADWRVSYRRCVSALVTARASGVAEVHP